MSMPKLWRCGFPFLQSRHSHSCPHCYPALKHSQQFFWHEDFLHVHLLAGTQAGTPVKWPGLRQLATLWAWQMPPWLAGWLPQHTQTHFSLQLFPRAKHSQQSFKQSIFVHLHPVGYYSVYIELAGGISEPSPRSWDFLCCLKWEWVVSWLSGAIRLSKRSRREQLQGQVSQSQWMSCGLGGAAALTDQSRRSKS